jgi:hypothetical protein
MKFGKHRITIGDAFARVGGLRIVLTLVKTSRPPKGS